MNELNKLPFKPIVMFFSSFKDIYQFIQVSKRAQREVLSLNTSPYNLSTSNNISSIVHFFPFLKILNIANRTIPFKAKELKGIYIPIYIRNYECLRFPKPFFTIKEHLQSLRRIGLKGGLISDFANHIKKMVNLETIVLNDASRPEVIQLLQSSLVRKFIIFCGIGELKNILNQFNFQTNNITKYFIIIEKFINCEELAPLTKKLSSNVFIYVNFISMTTFQFPFIPRIKQPNMTSILTDCLDKNNDFVIKTIEKAQLKWIRITDQNITTSLKSNEPFDLKCDSIIKIQFETKQQIDYIIGKNVEELIIDECKSLIDTQRAKMKILVVNKYGGKSLFIDDTNLQHIVCPLSPLLLWRHCGEIKNNCVYIKLDMILSQFENVIGSPDKSLKAYFDVDETLCLEEFDEIKFGNNQLVISFLRFSTIQLIHFNIDYLTVMFWIGKEVMIKNITNVVLENCSIDAIILNSFKTLKITKSSCAELTLNSCDDIQIESTFCDKITFQSVGQCKFVKVTSTLSHIESSKSVMLHGCVIETLEVINPEQLYQIQSKFHRIIKISNKTE